MVFRRAPVTEPSHVTGALERMTGIEPVLCKPLDLLPRLGKGVALPFMRR